MAIGPSEDHIRDTIRASRYNALNSRELFRLVTLCRNDACGFDRPDV